MRNIQRQPQVIQIIINPPASQRQMRRGRKAHPRGHAFGIQAGEAFEGRGEYRTGRRKSGYRHGKHRHGGWRRNESMREEGQRTGRPHREHTCSCEANRRG